MILLAFLSFRLFAHRLERHAAIIFAILGRFSFIFSFRNIYLCVRLRQYFMSKQISVGLISRFILHSWCRFAIEIRARATNPFNATFLFVRNEDRCRLFAQMSLSLSLSRSVFSLWQLTSECWSRRSGERRNCTPTTHPSGSEQIKTKNIKYTRTLLFVIIIYRALARSSCLRFCLCSNDYPAFLLTIFRVACLRSEMLSNRTNKKTQRRARRRRSR